MNACLLADKTMTQHLCEIELEGHITVTEDIHPFRVPSIPYVLSNQIRSDGCTTYAAG